MFSRSEKILLAILSCIQFSHIVDFMILMPLGPHLMRIFNITPHQFGLLRGSAIGITTSAFSVASVFGVPFSLYLADSYGWHSPFIFLGVLSVVVWSGIYFVMLPMKKHLMVQQKGNHLFHVLQHIYQTPNLRFALGFMCFLILGHFTIIPFLSPSLVANTGLPENYLKYIYLVGGIISIFASPLVGRLSDKYGRKKIFLVSALASLIPILIITHLGVNSVLVTLSYVAFFFLCMSGRMVPAMATISSAPIPQYRGSFMSIAISVQQLSAAVASYLAGLIVFKDSQGQLVNYGYAGFFAVGCTLIAIYFSRKVKETS